MRPRALRLTAFGSYAGTEHGNPNSGGPGY